MYELVIFKGGFALGLIVCHLIIMWLLAIILIIRYDRLDKFLGETNQKDRFYKWDRNNRIMLKFIKKRY